MNKCVARDGECTLLAEDAPILRVHGFSCLKDIAVVFKRIVVFIGEQASGKSVTCKLYYFFTQALENVARNCLREDAEVEAFQKRLCEEFCVIFPATAWNNDTFQIEWKFGARRMVVSHKRGRKHLGVELCDYAERYKNALEAIRSRRTSKAKHSFFNEPWRMYSIVERAYLAEFPSLNVDYIPAGRSFFSTIQSSIFSLLANDIGIDYFLKEFGQKFEMLRHRRLRFGIGAPSPMDELFQTILHGKYEFDGKEQWIVSDKKHRVKLSEASSGQQEALPLLLLLNGFMTIRSRESHMNRVILEEPEAHLYPTAQQLIIEFLGKMLLDKTVGCIITTHSPFILCCLNNVLKHVRGLTNQVTAYHLHDGMREDIFDSEFELINATRFDDISFAIANV